MRSIGKFWLWGGEEKGRKKGEREGKRRGGSVPVNDQVKVVAAGATHEDDAMVVGLL